MRVALIGIGAIGGLVASLLSSFTSARILLCARAQRAESLRSAGLLLKVPSERGGGRVPQGRLANQQGRWELCEAEDSVPSEWIESADLVIICTKAGDTAEAARIAALLTAAEGYCLSLQNGIGNEEVIASRLGLHRVLGAVITHGASKCDGDEAVWAGEGELRFGPLPASEIAVAELKIIETLFEQACLNPVVVEDARAEIWSKLAINAAINPLAAICGVRNGALLEQTLFERASASLLEVTTLARTEGVSLSDDVEMITFLRSVLINTAENRCSMLQDVMAGRQTETDSISGEVVRRGEEAGVPTPVNATLDALVQGITMSQSLD